MFLHISNYNLQNIPQILNMQGGSPLHAGVQKSKNVLHDVFSVVTIHLLFANTTSTILTGTAGGTSNVSTGTVNPSRPKHNSEVTLTSRFAYLNNTLSD